MSEPLELNGAAPPGGGPATSAQPAQRRAFGLASMVLFSVSAILVADTVASSAALGVAGLTLWLVAGVFFFLPYGLVTAELGSAWPDEGGIYVWVREAFGSRWATVTSWLYWVNVAFWAPSVFVLIAGIVRSVWWPDMPRPVEVGIVLFLLATMAAVGIAPMRLSKWVPDTSAALKTALLLFLGLGGASYAATHGVANSFAPSQWVPSLQQDLTYLPVVIFSLMGFELMSSAGDEIENPKRDVPKMVGFAGVIILCVYMFATFGILACVPLKDISIVTGISDALALVFQSALGGLGWPFYLAIVVLIYALFGTMATWSMGANHAIAAASRDDAVPPAFGKESRWATPWFSAMLMAVIGGSVTVLNYALFATEESVFWTIFALSSCVFLLPYLLMFPAALVLRRTHAERPRPYRVPGGRWGIVIAAVLCEVTVATALFLFFYAVPKGTPKELYWAVTMGGSAICVGTGLWFARKRAVAAREVE